MVSKMWRLHLIANTESFLKSKVTSGQVVKVWVNFNRLEELL